MARNIPIQRTPRTLGQQMGGDMVAGRHGRTQRPEEVPQEYAAFKIEQRGIDLIPDADRR